MHPHAARHLASPTASLLTALLTCLLLAPTPQLHAQSQKDTAPGLLMGRGSDLLRAAHRYQAGDPAAVAAVKQLMKDADAALLQPVTAVTQKPADRLPPSGDAHDYASLSPYRWPNPDTPDGLPYIRKDGQVNPERDRFDQPRMDILNETVRDLALAYYFTGDERYAENAARRLRTWFLDPATRMNPNLKYAQFIPGEDEPNHYGIIETGRLLWIPDNATLLRGSSHWTSDDDHALRAWFTDYLDWLVNSNLGKEEQAAKNNHGTWCHVQIVTYALYTGQDDLAREYLNRIPARIAWQIEPDGKQPLELERTQALHYSDFNLRGMLLLARLGEHVGIDLYSHQTDDGRSIRAALDYLLPYMLDPASFPYEQIKKPKFNMFTQTLRMAARGFNEPKYEQAIRALSEPLPATSWYHLVMAPLPSAKAQ